MDAAEGAKLAQKRFGRFWKGSGLEDDDENPYECMNCGCDKFYVEMCYDQIITIEEELPCTCDAGEEYAARVRRVITNSVIEKGVLGIDHRLHEFEDEDDDPEIENIDDEILDEEIVCEECYSSSREEQWETIEEDTETADEENWVRCCECDHEIEFGYSHLEGGRIWPCESKDFNPWKTFPIRRYFSAWKKRGWLRPEG